MLKPNPQGMCFGSGHEGGALVNGVSTLQEGTPESSQTPSASEDTAKRQLPVKQEVGPHQAPNLLVP